MNKNKNGIVKGKRGKGKGEEPLNGERGRRSFDGESLGELSGG